MNHVASRRAASHVPIASVDDVCEFVDELERAATGELVLDDGAPLGSVFIEQGRICWAAAVGLAARLTDLLAARTGMDARTMEDFYRTCAAEGAPLGEYLVERAVIEALDLRLALAQHTVESLVRMTDRARRGVWYPKAKGGYSPRFTLGTAEVLARAGELGHVEAAAAARAEIEECFAEHEWAVAFVRDGLRAVPCPVLLWGSTPSSASTLVRIARWVASSLDVADTMGKGDPLVAVTLPRARAAPKRENPHGLPPRPHSLRRRMRPPRPRPRPKPPRTPPPHRSLEAPNDSERLSRRTSPSCWGVFGGSGTAPPG